MNPKFLITKNKKGQGLVEYALLAALIGLVIAGVLTAFGPQIKTLFGSFVSTTSGGKGDFEVVDGELIIDGISPTLYPTSASTPSLVPPSTPTTAFTSTPTFTPTATFTYTPTSTPTFTPTATFTPTPTFTSTATSTPTVLACTAGSATNVANASACTLLSANNGCSTSTYNKWTKKCTWPKP
jgi:Flp pilus assembly pilin Flp